MRHNAKWRAKKDGVPFTITYADFDIPAACPVLGIAIKRGVGRVSDNSPSLDRIEPAKGYVPGNVEVISFRANTLKSNGTADEHRLVADYIDKALAAKV